MRFVLGWSTAPRQPAAPLLREKQTANLVLPWQSMNELIEMERGFRCRQYMAVHVHELEVGQYPHWVYHRYYTSRDLDPIPS